jgi:hypothetical protein
MSWIITIDRDHKPGALGADGRHVITASGEAKGQILRVFAPGGNRTGDHQQFKVSLLMVPELDFVTQTLQQAVAYVRGVEATVNLYGQEVGAAKRRVR